MFHQARQLIFVFLIAAISVSADSAFRINDEEIAALPKSHPVVVVNFWATWCEPCVEEIPIFVKLAKQNPKVQFAGISMDEADQGEAVQKFAKDHGMTYRVVLREGKSFEAMVNSMDPDWIGGLPATFVFRDGKRVFSKTGPVTEKELEQALNH